VVRSGEQLPSCGLRHAALQLAEGPVAEQASTLSLTCPGLPTGACCLGPEKRLPSCLPGGA
jgi:hypothetical protein